MVEAPKISAELQHVATALRSTADESWIEIKHGCRMPGIDDWIQTFTRDQYDSTQIWKTYRFTENAKDSGEIDRQDFVRAASGAYSTYWRMLAPPNEIPAVYPEPPPLFVPQLRSVGQAGDAP
jgi:hypothetical protein